MIEKGGHVYIITPEDEENMNVILRFDYKMGVGFIAWHNTSSSFFIK